MRRGAARPSDQPGRSGRLGLRREALAVLPAATILLALLALLAANTHRATIELWTAERQREAAALAADLAARAADGASVDELRRAAPRAVGVAILDRAGRSLATAGELPAGLSIPTPLGAQGAESSGPSGTIPGAVLAMAPVPAADGSASSSLRVAVHLPAAALDSQRRASRLLFPWIAALCAAAVFLVVLFVHRLLQPYDALLARAREAGGAEVAPEEDEVAFLLRSFERAVAGRSEESPAAPAPSRESALLGETLRRLGEVAAGVAHELRNGLATVKGYVSLLAPRHAATQDQQDFAEIRRELDQLQRVVDDFLSFARPGSARPRTVDARELLRQAATDPALQESGVSVRLEGIDEEAGPTPLAPLLLTVDPQLVERALRNLLRNAAQAQRDAGSTDAVAARVEERASAEGQGDQAAREVVITVEDRGPGLPAALRAHLGEPFVTTRPGGSGMGLALARRVAALHGGRLELEDRPGGGARAALILPSAHPDSSKPE